MRTIWNFWSRKRKKLKYLDAWMAEGYAAPFDKRMTQEYLTIRVLYEQ